MQTNKSQCKRGQVGHELSSDCNCLHAIACRLRWVGNLISLHHGAQLKSRFSSPIGLLFLSYYKWSWSTQIWIIRHRQTRLRVLNVNRRVAERRRWRMALPLDCHPLLTSSLSSKHKAQLPLPKNSRVPVYETQELSNRSQPMARLHFRQQSGEHRQRRRFARQLRYFGSSPLTNSQKHDAKEEKGGRA